MTKTEEIQLWLRGAIEHLDGRGLVITDLSIIEDAMGDFEDFTTLISITNGIRSIPQ